MIRTASVWLPTRTTDTDYCRLVPDSVDSGVGVYRYVAPIIRMSGTLVVTDPLICPAAQSPVMTDDSDRARAVGVTHVALSVDDTGESTDAHRHLGLVVDDTDLVERRMADECVDHVPAGMGASDLGKAESAVAELAEKGMAPE